LARDRSARLWSEAPRLRVVQTRRTGLTGILCGRGTGVKRSHGTLKELFLMPKPLSHVSGFYGLPIFVLIVPICVKNPT
jgi:hypothetical protein